MGVVTIWLCDLDGLNICSFHLSLRALYDFLTIDEIPLEEMFDTVIQRKS